MRVGTCSIREAGRRQAYEQQGRKSVVFPRAETSALKCQAEVPQRGGNRRTNITRNQNALVYASHEVIHQYQAKHKAMASGLYFNKHMSLLHRELLNRGHDLKLPHCWYQFGDEVVRAWMPEQIVWYNDSPIGTQVSWAGPTPHKQAGKGIDSEIKEVVSELSARYGTNIDKTVDAVYSYAPFDFQRKFRQTRQLYGHGANHQVAVSSPEVIHKALRNAFKLFPKKDFPDPANYAPLVADASSALLEETPQKLQLVNDLCEKFWNYFCYHLRLHPKGHENVPNEALEIWGQKLAPERANYELDLQLHLSQAFEAVPSLKDKDDFIPWVPATQYSKAQTAAILKGFDGAFEGLDVFAKQVRKGYGKTHAA